MIHNDHLATPQKMTDSSGAVVWSADYKPFGEATIIVSTITNNLRFPGQYYDAETGLNYNYFRDYNPIIGRYLQVDPMGLEGGMNPYTYVGNTPLNLSDPLGLVAGGSSYGSPPPSTTNYFPPYNPPQTPANCSLTGMAQEYVKMGERTVVTDPIGPKFKITKPYLVIGIQTQYKLEQVLWWLVIKWKYKCKDKCGKEYPLTLITTPHGDNDVWETIHMWDRTIRYLFGLPTITSGWRQDF